MENQDNNNKKKQKADAFIRWAEASEKAWKEAELYMIEAKALRDVLQKKREKRWKALQIVAIVGCTIGTSLMLLNLSLGIGVWVSFLGLMAVNSVLD